MQQPEVRHMALADLTMAPYNPRKITDKAAAGLAASLAHFGMLQPIVWNERTGHIVGGHQRYKRLVELGETETDVVVVDLPESEEVALNIALNSPTIRGSFTEAAIGLLADAEETLGEQFAAMRMDDLKTTLEKAAKPPGGSGGSGGGGGGGGEPPEGYDDGVAVIVTCPECKSRWLMKDNRVLNNAIAPVGD